jgi:glycosyltransferase involved in cell wall biosynthesis
MTSAQHIKKYISIVVPLYNEAANIPHLYTHLTRTLEPLPHRFEFIFVNDGSIDGSDSAVTTIADNDSRVRYIEFSRNFGKEIATTAGLHAAQGDAVVLIDADLQHPVEMIPVFIDEWQKGAEVVAGVKVSKRDTFLKSVGSRAFYAILKLVSETDITPHSNDFRLLDRAVVDAFNSFTEKNRMTRGLIDWLGFRAVYVPFEANERLHGKAQYSIWKLVQLFTASIIAHSFLPLRLAGYLGVIITGLSVPLGILMFLDRFIFPSWEFNFSGPAILAAILLFLVGIILICIGLLAFYIGHIFKETQNRPMYVVRKRINIG